jgi:hypothetical protein
MYQSQNTILFSNNEFSNYISQFENLEHWLMFIYFREKIEHMKLWPSKFQEKLFGPENKFAESLEDFHLKYSISASLLGSYDLEYLRNSAILRRCYEFFLNQNNNTILFSRDDALIGLDNYNPYRREILQKASEIAIYKYQNISFTFIDMINYFEIKHNNSN